MAYIDYRDEAGIPEKHRVPDRDNILRIHGVNSRVMKSHFDLYISLMKAPGPLAPSRREMIAVVVSAANSCRY